MLLTDTEHGMKRSMQTTYLSFCQSGLILVNSNIYSDSLAKYYHYNDENGAVNIDNRFPLFDISIELQIAK